MATRQEGSGRAGGEYDVFPAEFVERVRGLLGEEAQEFLSASIAPPTGLRVNTLRLEAERFAARAPFLLEPLPFPPEGFLVGDGPRPGRHPYHAAGLYYLQDPAAMVVGALVGPEPGERILDLAAAPGGKATHLAARLQGRGVLVANDVNPGRARELAGNLERCGVRNALVTSDAGHRLAERFGASFDRVLLDAPCSGEAMFHKSEAARADWTPAAVAGCARRQGDLLEQAARLVRPGGLLVYSTCTFSPEEDEEVIARFLDGHADYGVAELPRVPGANPGRPEWVSHGSQRAELDRTLRLWPHRVPGAGHFVAGLRRTGGEEEDPGALLAAAPNRAQRQLLVEFWDRFLGTGAPPEGLTLVGSELYALPEDSPSAAAIRVVRPGWWLGTLHRDRFDPSHALAMGLGAEDARSPLDLPLDDPRVLAFLRGESITAEGDPGWTLVCVSGFALGWGKRVGATVKNHFPKGLRWRSAAARG